ncbi:GNAT family N-acetyltransferase [Eubacterium ventriosum]|uniref:GNAT family N-acetyltransferase n=1 Tax=Eubacterium ventriosum TaxID=39496 RepID=A0A413RUL1_9FIRM|nr:GNAT family N-acetyltransferase [Eubacterium ventriosum]RHA51985.1 GNAT family N-acetyltransferase [Eubacterium ventriosum]
MKLFHGSNIGGIKILEPQLADHDRPYIYMATIEVVEFFYNLHSKENIKKDIKKECEGKFVGAGGVSYYNVMPTYHNHTGRKAYIMNMYTKPEYRRKGIAIKTLELLVKDAQEKGITDISLEATDIGKPLYEKFGFVAMESEMKL